jgi:hypothetical protein
MRWAVVAFAALVLAGCGSKKPDVYSTENTSLLNALPVYPGAAAPRTSTSGTSQTQLGARYWTRPAKANAEVVVSWYVPRLQKAGWRITGKNAGTIRAARGKASLSLGVRGRTLEAIVDARGTS